MVVTEANLGAWVLRCNPTLTDPVELFARKSIDRWCVAGNYRSRLMRSGQPVLFWLTGSRPAHYPRGFWGSGTVTGQARFGTPDSETKHAGDLHVPPHLTLWRAPIPASQVAAIAGLHDIEVLRQPQMANPSFLTTEQFARLAPLLPG